MGDVDAKNYLFFVGRKRFEEYIIEPLNELIKVYNNSINEYIVKSKNLEYNMPINAYENKNGYKQIFKNMSKEQNNTIHIDYIEFNVSIYSIFYLNIEKYVYNKDEEYDFDYKENELVKIQFLNENVEKTIIVPLDVFKNIFITYQIDINKLPITCYFAITPELTNEIDINKSKEFGSIFNELLNNKKLNYIFMSDVKQCHEFVGYFLLELCLSKIKNDEENGIIKFFNDIYVLPCLHDIKDRAGTINSYFDMKTDCRNNPFNDENYNFIDSSEKNKLIKDYTQDVSEKRKKDCTNIVIECGVNKTIQHYNINWAIYNNFYADGYRDQNKRGRRLCRETNFLGIFFDNFVVNARRIGEGGKKFRKSRKLRRSRKSRKYKKSIKSRKHKLRK